MTELDLRLSWVHTLAMRAVADRDRLPQLAVLERNAAELQAAIRDVPAETQMSDLAWSVISKATTPPSLASRS